MVVVVFVVVGWRLQARTRAAIHRALLSHSRARADEMPRGWKVLAEDCPEKRLEQLTRSRRHSQHKDGQNLASLLQMCEQVMKIAALMLRAPGAAQPQDRSRVKPSLLVYLVLSHAWVRRGDRMMGDRARGTV